jgi:hypothetical protein
MATIALETIALQLPAKPVPVEPEWAMHRLPLRMLIGQTYVDEAELGTVHRRTDCKAVLWRSVPNGYWKVAFALRAGRFSPDASQFSSKKEAREYADAAISLEEAIVGSKRR